MLTILSYCNRDDAITLKLFDWINQLGGCHNHDLLLIHDTRADKNLVQAILGAARAGWGSVYSHQNRAIVDGWPAGANYVFKLGATMASQKPELKYFFWLEPDAIPLKEKWLDMIEEEYLKAGKAFMGDHVQVGEIPEHMSGVGVYMNPIYALAGEALRSNEEAWDMAARFQILPNAHFTTLIEHSWKHP